MRLLPLPPGRPPRLGAREAQPPRGLPLPLHDATEKILTDLTGLQEALYAEGKRGLLIIFQGRDAAGKDATIRHVCSAFDPQGVIVTPFKVPTVTEAEHDYLWRIHAAVPPRRMIGVFNRSHYEDVLAPRVHYKIRRPVWEARYREINDFERTLVANAIIIGEILPARLAQGTAPTPRRPGRRSAPELEDHGERSGRPQTVGRLHARLPRGAGQVQHALGAVVHCPGGWKARAQLHGRRCAPGDPTPSAPPIPAGGSGRARESSKDPVAQDATAAIRPRLEDLLHGYHCPATRMTPSPTPSSSPHVNVVSVFIFFGCVLAGVFATLASGNPAWFLGGGVVGVVLSLSPRIAQQWERAIILRLGKYQGIRGPGLFWIVPFIDAIPAWIDQRVMTTGFAAEETLTSDTVPVNVDAVLFWMVHDPIKAALEVQDYSQAVSWAAQTGLRDIIGRTSLSDLLRGREQIEAELKVLIDERSSPWGVTVQSVEMRDVIIPTSLQDAMSREAQATREKAARIILGEAEVEIASLFDQAAVKYQGNPTALHLRAMNILYEGLKEKGALMLVPSSAVETMGLGGMLGAAALQQRELTTRGPASALTASS